jgi:hypothetical protein
MLLWLNRGRVKIEIKNFLEFFLNKVLIILLSVWEIFYQSYYEYRMLSYFILRSCWFYEKLI